MLICETLLVAIYRTLRISCMLNLVPSRKRLREIVRMLFYSRDMEIMLSTGVHLQEILALTEEIPPGLLLQQIEPARKAVDTRKSLLEAYSIVAIFSQIFVKMTTLGESSGHLSSSFSRIHRQNHESLKKGPGPTS